MKTGQTMKDYFLKIAKEDLREVKRRLNLSRPDIAELKSGGIVSGRVEDLRFVQHVAEGYVEFIEQLFRDNKNLELKLEQRS